MSKRFPRIKGPLCQMKELGIGESNQNEPSKARFVCYLILSFIGVITFFHLMSLIVEYMR